MTPIIIDPVPRMVTYSMDRRSHVREFVAELWVEATTSTEPRDVGRFGAHHRELRASLLISLDMQIDLHVVSNDPRSLNHLVPG